MTTCLRFHSHMFALFTGKLFRIPCDFRFPTYLTYFFLTNSQFLSRSHSLHHPIFSNQRHQMQHITNTEKPPRLFLRYGMSVYSSQTHAKKPEMTLNSVLYFIKEEEVLFSIEIPEKNLKFQKTEGFKGSCCTKALC
jgi:hypothetical protein